MRTPCVGGVRTDLQAADEAHQFHRDGVAFAGPAIGLLAGGLVLGAVDIAKAPNDPGWLRGTSIALLGGGVLATVAAITFDALSRHAQERSVEKCVVKLSDASHR